MSIKEILDYMNKLTLSQLLTDQTIKKLKQKKQDLSQSDKRFLLKKLSEFRKYDVHSIFHVIVAYSIWCPDEAIEEARKKGVFRYKAWGFKSNCAESFLRQVQDMYTIITFSDKTKKFIASKLSLSWMFKFYKKTEDDLVKYINEHHHKRKRNRDEDAFVEEALFKELLVYADLVFYSINRSYEYTNKNKLEGYSHEEICDSISYIIYLYDTTIGIKSDIKYNVSAQYILSNEIEKIILMGCKVNQLQEWEVSVDYFNYNVKTIERNYIIYDEIQIFEKKVLD
ncbi:MULTISPECIES: hypothetical protein [Paenibacillus]|uniref:Uncharacterized protein n=1 Tax=Paenibacillus pabuli TaxID=1472 RepID=A0A855XK79_9BACL|nr:MULTISPECIES: hypothetical protein [Paenibacillus]PWW32918.1 hypothetical protein DET56_12254 [Paenibacillus pabuli]PXV98801.1 hypothetical protein DEU73_12054 [Paenibacillus taichungensis]